MSKAVPSDWKKCEMNSEPQSQVTWARMLCFKKTWMTKSRARSLEMMVSWVTIKIPCLDSWSTTTRMEV